MSRSPATVLWWEWGDDTGGPDWGIAAYWWCKTGEMLIIQRQTCQAWRLQSPAAPRGVSRHVTNKLGHNTSDLNEVFCVEIILNIHIPAGLCLPVSQLTWDQLTGGGVSVSPCWPVEEWTPPVRPSERRHVTQHSPAPHTRPLDVWTQSKVG